MPGSRVRDEGISGVRWDKLQCPPKSWINDSKVQKIWQSGEHPLGKTMEWREYKSMTLWPCSKSYLLLQVPHTASPDPGYAPTPLWSQPSWVHISEEDKVSKEVTRTDLLSSAGDTLNQNCASIAWPFSWLSSCLWRTGVGKRGDGIKGDIPNSAHSWLCGSWGSVTKQLSLYWLSKFASCFFWFLKTIKRKNVKSY